MSYDVWRHLASWYQDDFKICRRVVKDYEGLKIDLYPEENMRLHSIKSRYMFTGRSEQGTSTESDCCFTDEMLEGKLNEIDTKE